MRQRPAKTCCSFCTTFLSPRTGQSALTRVLPFFYASCVLLKQAIRQSQFRFRATIFYFLLTVLALQHPKHRARKFSRCSFELLRCRSRKVFTAPPTHTLSCSMIKSTTTESKLCADNPRYATKNFLTKLFLAQLGKGRGFAPSRCIPSRALFASAKTEALFALGLCAAGAFRSRTVRP